MNHQDIYQRVNIIVQQELMGVLLAKAEQHHKDLNLWFNFECDCDYCTKASDEFEKSVDEWDFPI